MRFKGLQAFAVIAAVTASCSLATAASAATLKGVVVHRNARAHSFVVSVRGGRLAAVHAKHAPALGRVVTVSARKLRNGTWLALHIKLSGARRRVHVRGTVTYSNHRKHTFVVSARGVSLLVHARSRKGVRALGASASEPEVGSEVEVEGEIGQNTIEASGVNLTGSDPNGLNLEGTVEAIDLTARTLTISADDSELSGATTIVRVPAAFDINAFTVGEEVELIVSPNPDNTFTLEQSSDDRGGDHANDPNEIQGDDHGDRRPSASSVCAAQQQDPNFAATHNGRSFTEFWETDPNNPNDAFERCVDAMAHSSSTSPSPELQCHTEASDPNFAAAHGGQTFVQFYDPTDQRLDHAYDHCIDQKSGHNSGGGSGSGSGGGSDGGQSGSSSGSGGSETH